MALAAGSRAAAAADRTFRDAERDLVSSAVSGGETAWLFTHALVQASAPPSSPLLSTSPPLPSDAPPAHTHAHAWAVLQALAERVITAALGGTDD